MRTDRGLILGQNDELFEPGRPATTVLLCSAGSHVAFRQGVVAEHMLSE